MIRRLLALMILIFGLALVPAIPSAAACQGLNCAKDELNRIESDTGNVQDINSFAQTLVNTILYIMGVVAVIIITYAGFRYVTSGGDGETVKKAKNTIVYAVVGLVIAILAYAIVNLVLFRIL